MKKQILIVPMLAAALFAQAQDITQSQVPSVILNKFKIEFPKATDVEWEMDADLFNVEFETGVNMDQEIWYNSMGDIIRHEEDILVSELPASVGKRIKTDFGDYTIDDLKRITTKGMVVYKMDLESLAKQDQKVVIGADGIVISQIAD